MDGRSNFGLLLKILGRELFFHSLAEGLLRNRLASLHEGPAKPNVWTVAWPPGRTVI